MATLSPETRAFNFKERIRYSYLQLEGPGGEITPLVAEGQVTKDWVQVGETLTLILVASHIINGEAVVFLHDTQSGVKATEHLKPDGVGFRVFQTSWAVVHLP